MRNPLTIEAVLDDIRKDKGDAWLTNIVGKRSWRQITNPNQPQVQLKAHEMWAIENAYYAEHAIDPFREVQKANRDLAETGCLRTSVLDVAHASSELQTTYIAATDPEGPGGKALTYNERVSLAGRALKAMRASIRILKQTGFAAKEVAQLALPLGRRV